MVTRSGLSGLLARAVEWSVLYLMRTPHYMRASPSLHTSTTARQAEWSSGAAAAAERDRLAKRGMPIVCPRAPTRLEAPFVGKLSFAAAAGADSDWRLRNRAANACTSLWGNYAAVDQASSRFRSPAMSPATGRNSWVKFYILVLHSVPFRPMC